MPQLPLSPPLTSALDLIGNTPMVQLGSLPRSLGIRAQVFAKLEYYNAGGSVKDRVGLAMVTAAEKEGRLKPGDTIIEATSGNTGIALALISAIKGYKCIITISEKMSEEKILILKSLGATIVRTPAGVPIEPPESIISVAKRLQKGTPNSHILDQYRNQNNPEAHELGTGPEIWAQCEGKVDAVVVGAGTGGTITGIGRCLKRLNENVYIVGVDPVGSVLAQPEELNEIKREYKIEGIGYDFVPTVLDRSIADIWLKTSDADSFNYARKLIKEEGLLCGGSSGAAFAGLVEFLKSRPDLNCEGTRIVLILPDGIRNYLTKFVDDKWMEVNGYFNYI
ncbi:hypothetical protein AOL_s00097g64 [Orbilia oligospora ATCC 24927]|uniref:cystathionine beta-synthase n=1 Tax=Arthrobotrys oligospora (strain ATCC 24927 / CBS 115.81 / DSM 1491) TaxID=756982 RepID=G1XI87_ARTOA|nr:hypothetical protein AOL_s00097g64 [Orbilia oligospora ATCC 24927]EGX47018.1 hypothetical protein AOL_s00097g64 [Orbilia oligospora ATCC 24927]